MEKNVTCCPKYIKQLCFTKLQHYVLLIYEYENL